TLPGQHGLFAQYSLHLGKLFRRHFGIDVGDNDRCQLVTWNPQVPGRSLVGVLDSAISRVYPKDRIGRVVYSILRELKAFFRRQPGSDIAKGEDGSHDLGVAANWRGSVLNWK